MVVTDYSYVDVRYVSSTEPESATEEEINKGMPSFVTGTLTSCAQS